MDEIFKALGDPNRRKILELLKEKDMNVSEILKNFGFRQASLSHHLDILKRSNLIKNQRRGQFIYYSINNDTINSIIEYTKNLINIQENNTKQDKEIKDLISN